MVIAAVANVQSVLASLDDVRVDIEVGKEGQHDQHVARQQVLTPDGKVALNVDTV